MGNNLTFSIKSIFDADSAEGVLKQKKAKKYYIAPYQRGYKWASSSPDDAVCVLISDLIEAKGNSEKNPDAEYLLQFITIKESKIKEDVVLEVIDGQQRLTTLTVLLSVLEYIIGDNEKAISNDLLSYEVRPEVAAFFQEHIYHNIGTLMDDTWDDYIKKYPDNDEQDIYYLFSAAKKINELLRAEFIKDKNDDEVIKFKSFLLENVKLILNYIEDKIDCEEIFSNLNDNKVELTSSELVKGLILTNIARETPYIERETNNKDKVELRAIIGRQWDEMSHWANREEIKKFYFSKVGNVSEKSLFSDDVLDKLLYLFALDNGFDKTSAVFNKNSVFNYFQLEINKREKTAGVFLVN